MFSIRPNTPIIFYIPIIWGALCFSGITNSDVFEYVNCPTAEQYQQAINEEDDSGYGGYKCLKENNCQDVINEPPVVIIDSLRDHSDYKCTKTGIDCSTGDAQDAAGKLNFFLVFMPYYFNIYSEKPAINDVDFSKHLNSPENDRAKKYFYNTDEYRDAGTLMSREKKMFRLMGAEDLYKHNSIQSTTAYPFNDPNTTSQYGAAVDDLAPNTINVTDITSGSVPIHPISPIERKPVRQKGRLTYVHVNTHDISVGDRYYLESDFSRLASTFILNEKKQDPTLSSVINHDFPVTMSWYFCMQTETQSKRCGRFIDFFQYLPESLLRYLVRLNIKLRQGDDLKSSIDKLMSLDASRKLSSQDRLVLESLGQYLPGQKKENLKDIKEKAVCIPGNSVFNTKYYSALVPMVKFIEYASEALKAGNMEESTPCRNQGRIRSIENKPKPECKPKHLSLHSVDILLTHVTHFVDLNSKVGSSEARPDTCYIKPVTFDSTNVSLFSVMSYLIEASGRAFA